MKLYRIRAVLLKYWYFSTSDASRWFDILYWPLMGTIVFGFTTLYLADVSSFPSVVLFLLGGLIIWSLFERLQQDISIFVLEDFWGNNVANMFTTPLKPSELFIALIIVGFVRSLIAFAIMFFIALGFYHFAAFGANAGAAVFIIPLLLFGWALGIAITAIIFRFGPRIQIMAWGASYLLQPIGAVFYPVSALPHALQVLASVFPLAYIFEGYRLAYAGVFSWSLFLGGMGLAVAYLIIGYVFFLYAISYARKKGTLAKY